MRMLWFDTSLLIPAQSGRSGITSWSKVLMKFELDTL